MEFACPKLIVLPWVPLCETAVLSNALPGVPASCLPWRTQAQWLRG
jgi:hypothetical protein